MSQPRAPQTSTPAASGGRTGNLDPGLPDWPHAASDLEPHPDIVWGHLANGLRYALLPHPHPPGRISLRLVVAAGSLMEDDDQRGVAHFVEHMAFQGSAHLAPGDLVRHLERLGIGYGAGNNAHTDFDRTIYRLELPEGSPLVGDLSLAVLREIADRLLLDTARIEAERGVLLSELRLRATPAVRAKLAELELIFPEALLPQRFPLGLEDVIRDVPRQRLEDFYSTWYTPRRTTVVAVGDLDPKRFAAQIERAFESFRARRGESRGPDLGHLPPRCAAFNSLADPALPATVSLFGVAPRPPGHDSHARRATILGLKLAERALEQRLARAARDACPSFAKSRVRTTEVARFARLSSIVLSGTAAAWPEALATAEHELRRALEHGFSSRELDEQSADTLRAHERLARRASTFQASTWADDLARKLGAGEVVTHPDADLALVRQDLATLRPADLDTNLQTAWRDAGPLVMVAGDLGQRAGARRVRSVFLASRDQPLTPLPAPSPMPLAQFRLGKRTSVVERHDHDDLDLAQLTFGNGIRVNLMPTCHALGQVCIGVRFGGGLLEDPGTPAGLCEFAERSFLRGGLTVCSAEEIVNRLSHHPLSLRFSVSEDAFTFLGRSTREGLSSGLQVMAGYLAVPGFRPEARQAFIHLLAQRAAGLRSVAEVEAGPLRHLLHGSDPRFAPLEPEVAAQLSLDELRAWMHPALSRSYLEISLVGDFLIPSAVRKIASTFGSLPAREATKPAYRAERRIDFPRERHLRTFTFKGQEDHALAAVYWPTTDRFDRHDTPRLNILSAILANRLRDDLRGQHGAYTPQAAHLPSTVFPGYGVLYAGCDAPPDTGAGLTEVMRELAAEMATQGVSHDELHRALQPLLQRGETVLASNAALLNLFVLPSQEQPERLDWLRCWLDDARAITRDEVVEVARRYLQPEEALPVVVRPDREVAKPR